MYKSFFIFLLLTPLLYANPTGFKLLKYKQNYIGTTVNQKDIYRFSYDSTSKSCKLSKNKQEIPLFDPRFKKKAIKTRSYRCAAWVKEQYSSCKVSNTPLVSSVALSYGKYEQTNLVIGFNILHPNLNGTVEVHCVR